MCVHLMGGTMGWELLNSWEVNSNRRYESEYYEIFNEAAVEEGVWALIGFGELLAYFKKRDVRMFIRLISLIVSSSSPIRQQKRAEKLGSHNSKISTIVYTL